MCQFNHTQQELLPIGDRRAGVPHSAAMADRLLLLTGEAEAPVLTRALKRHRPDLAVQPLRSADDLAYAASARHAGRTRLAAFSTNILVPAAVLSEVCDAGALNFHPGPPEVPGVHTAAFALYEGLDSFGVTLHHMAARPDAGPIIAVRRFPVAADATRESLEIETYTALARLFMEHAAAVADFSRDLPADPGETWSARLRTFAAYDRLRRIPADLDAAEAARRRRAFAGEAIEPDPAREA
jgi:methionyl-tRNA formyltransferase